MSAAFKEEVAAHMAAYLIRKSPGQALLRTKLIKLLYLAERQCLKTNGYSISNDDFVSMPFGPVPSNALNLADGKGGPNGPWETLIQCTKDGDKFRYTLREDALRNNGPGHLSQWGRERLDEVWGEFGHMTGAELTKYTHANCPEWEDPGEGSKPIMLATILEAVGHAPENVKKFVADAESHAAFCEHIKLSRR